MNFFLSALAYVLFFPGMLLMVLSWPKNGNVAARLELLLGGAMVFAAGFVLAAAVLNPVG